MNIVNYETIAEEYARHRQVNSEVLRSLIETTGISSSSKILEVGCGSGNYISALEKAVGCACWGIDPSERMLANARGKSPSIHFRSGKAEELDFADDWFDLVFSVDVIHHVGDRVAFFREALRVLRPGGQVWTVTDSEDTIRHRQPLATYFPEIVEVELARYPSVSEMRRLMGRAGFHHMTEAVVGFSFQVTDASAYRDKAFSSLHLIPAEAHCRGLERMEQDLKLGPIQGNSRYYLLWAAKAVEN